MGFKFKHRLIEARLTSVVEIFTRQSFCFVFPTIWNCVPSDIQCSPLIATFKSILKTLCQTLLLTNMSTSDGACFFCTCTGNNRNHHTTMENHMPCGITQCYLPPGSGDFPAFTPAETGTRFSDPGGMQSWVDLDGGYPKIVYPRNTVTYLTNNRVVSWLGIETAT